MNNIFILEGKMKTLLIIGHSKKNSLSHAIAKNLAPKYEKNGEVRVLDLENMKFDPILKGFDIEQELEDDLVYSQESILWADHIVIIFPIWWSTYPAILKGFIDRVFLPGFAFKYLDNIPTIEKMLKGRTSELFITADSPNFYRRFILGDPAVKALKRDTLEFCGIKVKKVHRIGSIFKKEKGLLEKSLNKLAPAL